MNAEVKRYFGDAGLTVVRDIALQCTSWTGIAAVTPIECRDAIRRLDGTDVNAVVQVGTNLSMMRFAAAAELWLGKPVIAINTATYWHALRANGIHDQLSVLRPAARISLIGPNGVRALVDQQSGGEGAVHLLGAVLAILSGATFALTNATGRRGVISGTPAQGMIISMPVGLACFLAVALLTGALQSLNRFSTSAFATLSAAGVFHFVLGRYCNFRASQAAGVNLTAPVIQLNSVVTLVLAVAILQEPCTMLQATGAVLMVAGSLVTQRSSEPAASSKLNEPAFKPRVAVGFFFALVAALAYGTSPIIVRQALQDVGPLSGVAGASVAYGAATVAVALGLLIPSLRRNVVAVTAENARWFVYSGIFVAAAHGFLYSALAVAPIMVGGAAPATLVGFPLCVRTYPQSRARGV